MIFKFASLQSDIGQKLFELNDLSDTYMETVVYLRDNQVFQESSAILEILRDLGGIWKVLIIISLIPNSISDRIYRFIAKRRYSIFGKRKTCLLPTPENNKRFLT
jgi:predicted DCC family thiol-disulfide oxidoreductase YuxK